MILIIDMILVIDIIMGFNMVIDVDINIDTDIITIDNANILTWVSGATSVCWVNINLIKYIVFKINTFTPVDKIR